MMGACVLCFLAQPFQVRIGSDNHGEPQTTQCGTDPMVRGGKATGSRLSGKKMAESAFKKWYLLRNLLRDLS